MFLLAIAVIITLFLLFYNYNKEIIENKTILIIGGTSGLGFELAKVLSKSNKVTITSRSKKKLYETIKKLNENKNLDKTLNENVKNNDNKTNKSTFVNGFVLDPKNKNLLDHKDYIFDFIFYIPGFAIPGYFLNQKLNDFKNQINVNFLGMIRCLYYFIKNNKLSFTFVTINSTAALFPFPGYSSYSCSKKIISTFFQSVKMELIHKNNSVKNYSNSNNSVYLKQYYCSGIKTKSFYKENLIKPEFTKKIEFMSKIYGPEVYAKYLINNINRKNISMDWFTYFLIIKEECECFYDYLMFPIAVIVVFISRVYVEQIFKRYFNK